MDSRERSQALLLAQQKLNSLRSAHRDQESLAIPKPQNHGRLHPHPPTVQKLQGPLPNHLGWGSVPLTQALRRVSLEKAAFHKSQRPQRAAERNHQNGEFAHPAESLQEALSDPLKDRTQIRLYPDLALGMLGQKMVAAGRIWLLLQHIDQSGRGWLNVTAAREQLTKKNAAFRICGGRQLRKLLARGEGLFWIRNHKRIWLRSPAKVAAALGITHLRGRPVALPLSALLQGIGLVRAHFYASFHSGRTKKQSGRPGDLRCEIQSSPLSRATLQLISHVKPRTQRQYEKQARVQRQPNFVINKQSKKEEVQDQAWRRGQAWFRFTDHTGKLGEKGAVYSAWQLPNSYVGPHEQQPIGRQKRINQELADLSMKGMTGNGKGLFQEAYNRPTEHVRLFHKSGAAAAMSFNRHPDGDAFWRSRLRRSGQYEFWHFLPGKGSR